EAAWLPLAAVADLLGPSDRILLPLIADDRSMVTGLYKPSKPSTFGAMAVHHILPHELEGCPPSSECKLPADAEYIVGHNVDYDWEAVGKPNVKRICTCAMARWVWPEADSHSQSALLYMTLGATDRIRKRLMDAHRAA